MAQHNGPRFELTPAPELVAIELPADLVEKLERLRVFIGHPTLEDALRESVQYFATVAEEEAGRLAND